MSWICDNMVPYSIVQNARFRAMIRNLQPKFTIPSEKTVRTKLIPQFYQKLQYFVLQTVKNITNYAIITDAWTSSQQECFLSFTVHFIDEKLQRKMIVLRTIPFNKSHTAHHIRELVIETLGNWNFQSHPFAVLRDSASNVVKAFKEMNGIACTIDTIQLVLKHSLLRDVKLSALAKKARAIVKKLKNPKGNLMVLVCTPKLRCFFRVAVSHYFFSSSYYRQAYSPCASKISPNVSCYTQIRQ